MTANELMIGDWVFSTHNRKPGQVAKIGCRLVMLDYNDVYEYDLIATAFLALIILLGIVVIITFIHMTMKMKKKE